MELKTKLFFLTIVFLINAVSSNGDRIQRVVITNEPCGPDFFRCDNDRCVRRNYRCDKDQDCGDGSDERNCSIALSSIPFRFESIDIKRKSAEKWLIAQAKDDSSMERWGYYVPRIAIALYLANETYFYPRNVTGREIAFELSVQMLSRLATREIGDVSNTELASFINGFLVTCINPRNFQGINLVEELRRRVDLEEFVNPFVMIALCNAEDNFTAADVEKLKSAFNMSHREIWTDIQALSVIALSCIKERNPSLSDSVGNLSQMTETLKQLQDVNGTVDNLKSTALVLQALISTNYSEIRDDRNFDSRKSLAMLLSYYLPNGAFHSDVLNTYFALPVLSFKSLANISSKHCVTPDRNNDEILREWMSQIGEKHRIKYSLWLGRDRYLEKTMSIIVPANTSFYKIMQVAAKEDTKYSFGYTMRSGKPYVYSVANIEDDPENGKFWFLYTVNGTGVDPTITLIKKSPLEYIPKGDDHLVLWYRKGPWMVD